MAPSTWTVVKHVKGSSHHETSSKEWKSWTQYWKFHTKEEVPAMCPGEHKDKVNPHPLEPSGVTTVGCHVLIQDEKGNKLHAIVPACSGCNKQTRDTRNLNWLCKAVTIMDPLGFTMVGKILLPSPPPPKGKRPVRNTEYWTEITYVGGGDVKITIEGYTNKHKRTDGSEPISRDYPNDEDYLLLLATMFRAKAVATQRTIIRKEEKDFKPEILTCNVGMYPASRRADYKGAHGICRVDGCHEAQKTCQHAKELERTTSKLFYCCC